MGLRCKADFSDVDAFFELCEREVKGAMVEVGEKAIEYAKANGNYEDPSGHLRESNKFRVEPGKLVLYNDAQSAQGYHYAANVEAKGYDVLSGAALYAEALLKAKFEK